MKKKGLSPKLQKFWDGPYLIVNKLSDALYRIQKSIRSSCKIVHYNRLKLFNGKQRVPWVSGIDPTLVLEESLSTNMNRIDRPKLECPSDSDMEDSDAEIQPAEAVAVEDEEVVQERGHSSVPAEEVTADDKEVIPEGSESSVSVEARMSTDAGTESEKTVKDQGDLRRSKRNIQPPRRLIEEI